MNGCHVDNMYYLQQWKRSRFEDFQCQRDDQFKLPEWPMLSRKPLTRYVNLWVAHAPGISSHRLQMFKGLLVSDPGIHHCTHVTHVPWCMLGSLARGGGENFPSIPSARTTRNFTYLTRGPSAYRFEVPLTGFAFIEWYISLNQRAVTITNTHSKLILHLYLSDIPFLITYSTFAKLV